jgi:hypothetical protein
MAAHTPGNPESPGTLAAQHMQAGRLAEAEAIYRQMLDDYPTHHEALFKMGILLSCLGEVSTLLLFRINIEI